MSLSLTIVCQPRLEQKKIDFKTILLALGANFLPVLLIVFAKGKTILPEFFKQFFMMIGVYLQIFALFDLKKNFDFLPALRGKIIISGTYRLVRHPFYLGSSLVIIAFTLGEFSIITALLGTLNLICIFLLIRKEESYLSQFDEYKSYKKKITKMIFPFIF